LARQYRETTTGAQGVAAGWSTVVDVLVKFAGSEQILSVIQTAAFMKMSAEEVCEILHHVKDDTVVFDLKDEIFLKVVDGKV
jgi:hypothetical protein